MANQEPIDLSQTENNDLTKIAEEQRSKLFPKNNYNDRNKYSQTNPDALADGDERGKGTGVFLDVNNDTAGNSIDNLERVMNIKINEYNNKKTYPDF